jgi:hypothetical protein
MVTRSSSINQGVGNECEDVQAIIGLLHDHFILNSLQAVTGLPTTGKISENWKNKELLSHLEIKKS